MIDIFALALATPDAAGIWRMVLRDDLEATARAQPAESPPGA